MTMPGLPRVLFVDDEASVLDGMRRALRNHRQRWTMIFAQGGEEALRVLRQEPVELICSDMRMPGMDGATLLAHVQTDWPDTFRFILSGQTEQEAMLRSIPFVHRFLSKPCDPQVLADEIERVLRIRSIMVRQDLRLTVSGVGILPVIPKVLKDLTAILMRPDVSIRIVADEVCKDMFLSAKVLQLANSAYYGQTHQVANIEGAVRVLGCATLRSILITLAAFTHYSKKSQAAATMAESMQEHSLRTAMLARHLVLDPAQSEDAFLAGLLHDLGLLIIAANCPERFHEIQNIPLSDKNGQDIERTAWQFTHGEVGGCMLSLWGLSIPIVEAVTFHHEPHLANCRGFWVLGAVHVADWLARRHAPKSHEVPWESQSQLNLAYLQSVGQEMNIDEWVALSERHGQAEKGIE